MIRRVGCYWSWSITYLLYSFVKMHNLSIYMNELLNSLWYFIKRCQHLTPISVQFLFDIYLCNLWATIVSTSINSFFCVFLVHPHPVCWDTAFFVVMCRVAIEISPFRLTHQPSPGVCFDTIVCSLVCADYWPLKHTWYIEVSSRVYYISADHWCDSIRYIFRIFFDIA